MRLQRFLGGALAALTLATGALVAGTTSAHAFGIIELCGNRGGPCGIAPDKAVITEGQSVGVTVTGVSGASVDIQLFAVTMVGERPKSTPISPKVRANIPAGGTTGSVKITLTSQPVPAGFNGAQVLPQPSDWVVGSAWVAIDTTKEPQQLPTLQVLSQRGRDVGYDPETFESVMTRRLDAGLPGDKYSVQMLRGGKWVTIDNAGPATVGADGKAAIAGRVPADLPTGSYKTRLVNVTRNITDITPDDGRGDFDWNRSSAPVKVTDPKFNVYINPGVWDFNNRLWKTSCEPYSATERCRTEIKATQILYKNGTFTRIDDWVFNNLTYKPSPRSLWKGNPIGGNGVPGYKGSWKAADGRQWRVECDTTVSGRNGCRAYTVATVAEVAPGGGYRVVSKEVFNNIVLFN